MYPYHLITALSSIVMAMGIVILIGWFSDIDVLKSLSPTWVTMKFSTALSFLMSGLILFLLNEAKNKQSELAKILLPGPIIVVLFFMTTLAISNIVGVQTGVEQLFVSEEEDAIRSVEPGRPSFGTMVNFLLIVSMSLTWLLVSEKRRLFIYGIGGLVLLISGTALTGYASDMPALYYQVEGWSTAMALHTAIAFFLLGICLICLPTSKFESDKQVKGMRISIKSKISIIIFTGTIPTLSFIAAVNYSSLEDLVIMIPQIISIVVFASIASIFIAKLISTPISKLENTAKQISEGDLDTEIQSVQNDELGDLTSQFYSMREQIKTRTDQLKQLNKELIGKDKQKEEFTSMIAHELKGGLTPVKGVLEILLSKQLGEINEKQEQRLKSAISSTESIQKLISDLSDVQKIDLGVLRLIMEKHNMADIINEFLVQARQDLDQHGTTVTINLIENLTCVCDKERIKQVLRNLVYNSIDFCPKDNGEINISLLSEKNDIEIIVKDNGQGIPEDKLDKVFTKFYQVDSSMTRERGSSGLGLSVCQGIVNEHGGKIWVESKVGQGATFHILLPKNQSKLDSDPLKKQGLKAPTKND